MKDCIFCQIIEKKLPSRVIYEDEHILCVDDLYPKAPVHKLILTKKHIPSLVELTADDDFLISHLTRKLPEIAADLGLDGNFRTIINTGPGGGQVIFHLHYHLLGGGKLPGVG